MMSYFQIIFFTPPNASLQWISDSAITIKSRWKFPHAESNQLDALWVLDVRLEWINLPNAKENVTFYRLMITFVRKEESRHAAYRGYTITPWQTHGAPQSAAVSVSVSANQTPFQTPASYLATSPHFHGDAIKSNNKEKGKTRDDGPEKCVRERR